LAEVDCRAEQAIVADVAVSRCGIMGTGAGIAAVKSAGVVVVTLSVAEAFDAAATGVTECAGVAIAINQALNTVDASVGSAGTGNWRTIGCT